MEAILRIPKVDKNGVYYVRLIDPTGKIIESTPFTSQLRAWCFYRNNAELFKEEYFDSIIMPFVLQLGDTDVQTLKSKHRKRELVESRNLAYYLTRTLIPKISLVKLGKIFNRDHSSIIHGINQVQDQMDVNKSFYERTNQIEQHLRQQFRILES